MFVGLFIRLGWHIEGIEVAEYKPHVPESQNEKVKAVRLS